MKKTTASDVIESFESSLKDKKEIPLSLEMMWFEKALALYGAEIDPLDYDSELDMFLSPVSRYTVDILALMMKLFYQQMELSRVDKISSIVSKDISVNGTNGLQKYTHEEYEKIKSELIHMLNNMKPTAYN